MELENRYHAGPHVPGLVIDGFCNDRWCLSRVVASPNPVPMRTYRRTSCGVVVTSCRPPDGILVLTRIALSQHCAWTLLARLVEVRVGGYKYDAW